MSYFRGSEKFHSHFRCIPCSANDEATDRVTEIFLELYHQSPEEYRRDDRWRRPPPTLHSTTNRDFKPMLEVFSDEQSVRLVLERLNMYRNNLRRKDF